MDKKVDKKRPVDQSADRFFVNGVLMVPQTKQRLRYRALYNVFRLVKGLMAMMMAMMKKMAMMMTMTTTMMMLMLMMMMIVVMMCAVLLQTQTFMCGGDCAH